MAYLVFFMAEIYLRSSGPLAIVVYGLYFKVCMHLPVYTRIRTRTTCMAPSEDVCIQRCM